MPKKQHINKDLLPEIKKISLAIKNLRKDKGFTSYENFAVEFGLDRKQYWRIEEGANITLKTLITILDCHGMTLKDFFKKL